MYWDWDAFEAPWSVFNSLIISNYHETCQVIISSALVGQGVPKPDKLGENRICSKSVPFLFWNRFGTDLEQISVAGVGEILKGPGTFSGSKLVSNYPQTCQATNSGVLGG